MEMLRLDAIGILVKYYGGENYSRYSDILPIPGIELVSVYNYLQECDNNIRRLTFCILKERHTKSSITPN